MPQAGLNLLYQGMLKLTTEPHMLTSLMFWEATPGFSLSSGYLRCKPQNWHPPGADLISQSPDTPKQVIIHLGLAF